MQKPFAMGQDVRDRISGELGRIISIRADGWLRVLWPFGYEDCDPATVTLARIGTGKRQR